MPGLSVHAVDVARGVPARGMRIEVFALAPQRRLIAEGELAAIGRARACARQARGCNPGRTRSCSMSEPIFAAGRRAAGDPAVPRLVPFRFTIADPDQHYHLPMKITPWGFSLYRGS